MLLSLPQEDQPNTVEVLNNGVVEYSILGKINVSSTELFLLLPPSPMLFQTLLTFKTAFKQWGSSFDIFPRAYQRNFVVMGLKNSKATMFSKGVSSIVTF